MPSRENRADSPAGRLRRLVLLVALPLLLLGAVHLLSQQYGTVLPPQVLRLSEARLLKGDALEPAAMPGAMPTDAASVGTRRSLPLQINETEAPGALWLVMDFELRAGAATPFWLVIQHRPAAALYLDGQLIANSGLGSGYATEDEDDIAQRGLLLAGRRLQVSIPPSLLQAGPHRLSVRLARPGFEGAGLSAPLIGPASEMRALQEGRRFWQVLRVSTALAGLVIGAFMLMVWLALRQEWLYGVTGLFCLCTALLLSPYLLNGALLPAPWWRVTLDIADVVSKALLMFLVVRLFGIAARWPMRLFIGYLALGVVIDGWAAFAGWSWTDFTHPWPWWALGSRALVLAVTAALAVRAALASGRRALAVGAVAVALSGWLWGYVSWFALVASRQMGVVDVNVIGHAVLIAIAGVALQRRFVGSLRDQAMARVRLEQALDARTRELQSRWEQLQDSERQRTAAQERERLLQEMHDGLGSQLVTARLCAERGVASESLVGLLDDCIREMRLTVDALAVTDGDLTLLLANLRHRMGPRLQDAGLELDWQLADVPLVPALRGVGGRELIRIVQEALSNVIHHAGATRVRFETRVVEGGAAVMLLIADNGRGLDPARRPGNGLRGMRRRAGQLGARIDWRTPRDDGRHDGGHDRAMAGTEMVLILPLR
ncbi:ATP-binding protein [Roseateles sp.]|uniref:sensor histidine kinase n=1 Tax=Roseateles sp. TaxID=1971397 RepID=UPI0031D2FCF3